MSDVHIGTKSAVNRFKPRDPSKKNLKTFISDFHEFNDALVHRCKSTEGAKSLNVSFKKTLT